ncbi:Ethanolamine utilization protein EutH OS=Lysinibacillus sphaericus OX=1421 GN=LS41612_20795 PE=4 SV=1 [Lysinibacillus sphaericus]
MGALGLGMIGILSLAPVLTNFLSAQISPISKVFHLDPSIIPAAFLAVDMGGFQMAEKLALSNEMGAFSGIIIASTLGATVSFSIPVALGMLAKEDEQYFAKGVLIGIITSIPIGCLVAGLWQKINIILLVWNLVPIFVFTIMLGVGLLKAPHVFIKAFNLFGKFIVTLSTVDSLKALT